MRLLTGVAAGFALFLTSPALAAQDTAQPTPVEAGELPAITDMFSGMFTAEPLDPDQEARIPAAEQLIAKVIPEGTMAEMMDKVYSGVMGPMMAAAPDGATTTLARQIGLAPYELDLGEEQAAQLASLFDPAWAERQRREMAVIPAMMNDVMTLMEPGIRKAMAELYAIRFSANDLAQIDAFFSTPTGAKYARESFLMASDPRIMAASMEAMPALMGMMGDIEARMAESMADLPAVRSFADLSPEDRAKVSETTGFSVEDIEANLSLDEGDSDVE